VLKLHNGYFDEKAYNARAAAPAQTYQGMSERSDVLVVVEAVVDAPVKSDVSEVPKGGARELVNDNGVVDGVTGVATPLASV
jgi:hypothetical protein